MNGDEEELLCEGMDRFTAEVPVPAGILARARRRVRRRKVAVRGAGPGRNTGQGVQARAPPEGRRPRRAGLRDCGSLPRNACATTAALAAVTIPANHWSNYIHDTLGCGAAPRTGHVRIGDVQALKITGIPVTVKLPPNEAKAIHEKWAQARWTTYVNPKTYLPVRMSGSTRTFGGTGGSTLYSAATDAHWLSADRANIAKTLVTIPPGYTRVTSPASQ